MVEGVVQWESTGRLGVGPRLQSLALQKATLKTHGLSISVDLFPSLASEMSKSLVLKDREGDEKPRQKRRPVNVMLFLVFSVRLPVLAKDPDGS